MPDRLLSLDVDSLFRELIGPRLEEARALLARVAVVDAHVDLLWRARVVAGADFVAGSHTHHISHATARAAGVRLIGASLFTSKREHGDESLALTEEMIATARAMAAQAPDKIAVVTTRADLDRVLDAPADSEIVGLIPWIEGGSPFRGRLDVARRLLDAGVRGVILTHNHDNEIGGGCFGDAARRDADAGGGLTAFGRELIPLLEDAGCAIDLSHASRALFRDVVALARRPLAVSHVGSNVVAPSARQLPDDALLAIADSGGSGTGGGVIGIDFYPGHLAPPGPDGRGRCTVGHVVAAIEHVVNVAGEDHVAIGSDFDGYDSDCIGLETVEQLPNLVALLLAREHSEARVTRILTGNWRRFLGEVLPER